MTSHQAPPNTPLPTLFLPFINIAFWGWPNYDKPANSKPYRNTSTFVVLRERPPGGGGGGGVGGLREREIDGIALKYALDCLSISFDQPIIWPRIVWLNKTHLTLIMESFWR